MSQENESQVEEPKKKTKKEDTKTLKAEYEKLLKENQKLKEELGLAKDALKESMEMVTNFKMDVDRIKERSEKLNSQLHEKITMEVVAKLLPSIDNLEIAVSKMKEGSSERKGCEMIIKSLIKELEEIDIKRIECTAGVFDPNKMEAISIVSTDNAELVGTVAHVISTGYYYYPTDNVIRYTQVAVYK